MRNAVITHVGPLPGVSQDGFECEGWLSIITRRVLIPLEVRVHCIAQSSSARSLLDTIKVSQ